MDDSTNGTGSLSGRVWLRTRARRLAANARLAQKLRKNTSAPRGRCTLVFVYNSCLTLPSRDKSNASLPGHVSSRSEIAVLCVCDEGAILSSTWSALLPSTVLATCLQHDLAACLNATRFALGDRSWQSLTPFCVAEVTPFPSSSREKPAAHVTRRRWGAAAAVAKMRRLSGKDLQK
jgi:hypothetical protein